MFTIVVDTTAFLCKRFYSLIISSCLETTYIMDTGLNSLYDLVPRFTNIYNVSKRVKDLSLDITSKVVKC